MKVKSYILENKNGMEVEVLSAGAAIRRIIVPDKNGIFADVVLGFENTEEYFGNQLFAGAALGPVAGRISGAQLNISGKTYNLTKNDNENNFHGGNKNISFAQWHVLNFDKKNIKMRTFLEDGTDGFPGNRIFTAEYSLNDENMLTLKYTAVSDKDTYLNMSNHTYFNMSGDFSSNALNQKMVIYADKYIKNDKYDIPEELHDTENTPFDFRIGAIPEDYVKENPELLRLGYNNGFVLNKKYEFAEAVSLEDIKSGRKVRIYTDAPCAVVYSGGCIPNSLTLKDGKKSSAGCAIAIEPQDFPDALNCPFLHGNITAAGEVHTRVIHYDFNV